MARILVVDDQPEVLQLIESLLKKKSHVVVTAKDTFDGLEKVRAQTFDLVITDAVMPGGASGFDLVKTMRADAKLKSILMILLTGKREKRDVERGIQVGVDDYVIKPVDPEKFLAKIDLLLQKKYHGNVAAGEFKVSELANFQHDLKITGISDHGVSFTSAQPFHAGSQVTLESAFLTKVTQGPPLLSIISSDFLTGKLHYSVHAQFVEMKPESLEALRAWLRDQGMQNAG